MPNITTEEDAERLILGALKRVQVEKLDIDHFDAEQFMDYECWAAFDPEGCTIGLESTLPQLLIFLGEGKTWEG